ncbi:MAG: VOC family protein [Alphaproteobacteria bacterium]
MSTLNTISSGFIVQPYLFFGGKCEAAIEFYRTALGAQVGMLMRHSDSPEPPPPGVVQAGFENKIMHASFRIGETEIMASDGMQEGAQFGGFSLSLSVPDEAEARRAFALLADGGQVQMPLGKTFFASCFGVLTDKFGVSWMVIVPGEM